MQPQASMTRRQYFSAKRTGELDDKTTESANNKSKCELSSLTNLSQSPSIQHSLLNIISYATTPVSAASLPEKTKRLLTVPRLLRNKNEEGGIVEVASPTSTLDAPISTPLQHYIRKLLDLSSSGDIDQLFLVPDNARILPSTLQSTPKMRPRRPLFSKSTSDNSVINHQSKYRPCRWTSDSQSSVDLQQQLQLSPTSIQPKRPSSPPTLMSAVGPLPFPVSPPTAESLQSRKYPNHQNQPSLSQLCPGVDTQPIRPHRSPSMVENGYEST